MQIFATFDHSSYLELVISRLEEEGVQDLFAVPLDKRGEQPKLFDTIHQADGLSLINKGMFLAVIFSVVAASRGFVLEWGPIYWGLIGAVSGFILGVTIDLIILKFKNKNRRKLKEKSSEVILIVECKEEDSKRVEEILWNHFALGLAKIKQ
ncbi:hypothetical protein ACFO3D_18490 [Virgibacillus kekensis]|uniref:Uncharacterized protein n=1 Tax=Virgibacillus kekensis TaxID=202261 RepID=A0ABV9DMN6_9BACI